VTVVVWVLVIWVGNYGGWISVDNIDSERNCRALAAGVYRDVDLAPSPLTYSCRAVRKVAQ